MNGPLREPCWIFRIVALFLSFIRIPRCKYWPFFHSQREAPPPFSLDDFGFTDDVVPTFFTDGSDAFPKLGGHLAGWSIVLDTLTNDDDRCAALSGMTSYDAELMTFMPVQVSLVAGVQTINRAEFQAIIQVVRSCSSAIIYSDS